MKLWRTWSVLHHFTSQHRGWVWWGRKYNKFTSISIMSSFCVVLLHRKDDLLHSVTVSERDQACWRWPRSVGATPPMDCPQYCQSAYQPISSSLVDISQPAVSFSSTCGPSVGWQAVRSRSAWPCRCLRSSRCWGWRCPRWSNARWCYRPCSPGSWHK